MPSFFAHTMKVNRVQCHLGPYWLSLYGEKQLKHSSNDLLWRSCRFRSKWQQNVHCFGWTVPLRLINKGSYMFVGNLCRFCSGPAHIWWKRGRGEEIKWRSEDGCIKDETRGLNSLSLSEHHSSGPRRWTEQADGIRLCFTTLPSAQINDRRERERETDRENTMMERRERGKGRKISARISSMPSTAKWGLSGEFDRIQLKAVVDKMMMNCSRAAERRFASDSTHQFLPKHFDGREGGKMSWRGGGSSFLRKGTGSSFRMLGREGAVNNWRSLSCFPQRG